MRYRLFLQLSNAKKTVKVQWNNSKICDSASTALKYCPWTTLAVSITRLRGCDPPAHPYLLHYKLTCIHEFSIQWWTRPFYFAEQDSLLRWRWCFRWSLGVYWTFILLHLFIIVYRSSIRHELFPNVDIIMKLISGFAGKEGTAKKHLWKMPFLIIQFIV